MGGAASRELIQSFGSGGFLFRPAGQFAIICTMKHTMTTRITRWVAASLLAVMVAPLGAQSLIPTLEPKPAPALMTVVATAEFVEHILALTDREKALCTAVRDGVKNCDENAFYALMSKVATIPAMPADEFAKIDQPSYDNLLRKPDRYRYQPVRIKVRIGAYETWSEDNGSFYHPAAYWPKDKPMIRLSVNLPGDEPDTPPLILYCEHLPADMPRGKRVAGDDRRVFFGHKVAPVYTVAAMFYKITAEETLAKGTMMTPNLLVWQMVPEKPATPAATPEINKEAKAKADGYASLQMALGVLIAAVVVVLGYLWFLKKKVLPKYQREVGTFQGYSPKRDPVEERRDRQAQREADDLAVDPDLVAAAQSWRTDHGLSTEDTIDEPEDQPKDETE